MRVDQEVAPERIADEGAFLVSVGLFGEDGRESGRFELGTLYVTGEGRQFTPPAPETTLAADVGAALALVGYDGPRAGNQGLDLTLFWQAIEEMDISYKFYVHVFDAENGELVAQLDTVPRDWSYPTNEWHAGEYVSDRLSLPFSTAAPGTYRVEIGVYHPDTGERLPAIGADGVPYPNNSIPLAEVEVGE